MIFAKPLVSNRRKTVKTFTQSKKLFRKMGSRRASLLPPDLMPTADFDYPDQHKKDRRKSSFSAQHLEKVSFSFIAL